MNIYINSPPVKYHELFQKMLSPFLTDNVTHTEDTHNSFEQKQYFSLT
jgi:hypothetical protein